ncbi:MAG: 50S ribosomal protein L1 [Candidatus Lightella neohaematopini]|nr:50S ribosomal protein L1 [Candidatus Lightella neohaematopini]
MSKISKRMNNLYKKIDSNRCYEINQAIDILKENNTVKFIESIDVAIKLNINTKKIDHNIKNTVILPHSNGQIMKIAVFTQDKEQIKSIKKIGITMIGMEELFSYIKNHKKEKINFVIASPDAMPLVSKLGNILGPRNIMPNPKLGTVTNDIIAVINEIKLGKIIYYNDKYGIIHASIGRINFSKDKIIENLKTLMLSIIKSKFIINKNNLISRVHLSTTMGVGININFLSILKNK